MPAPTFRLDGSTALVTGAAGGIGARLGRHRQHRVHRGHDRLPQPADHPHAAAQGPGAAPG